MFWRTTNTMSLRSSNTIVRSHLPCPSLDCGSSDAYTEYSDGHGYCFSCKKYFNNNKLENFVSNEFTYEYVPHRGLTKETLIKYGIKTKIDAQGKPVAVGFTYPNGAVKVRRTDRKEFYWDDNGIEASKAGLFGKDKFSSGSHKYVTITEGEYDAASLYQVLQSPCVSVRSSSCARADCILERDWLSGFERIYLAFDGDAPGREAAADVAQLFDYNKVFFVKFTKHKDANAYLVAGEGDELRQLWWNSKKFTPDGILSTIDEFKEALKDIPKSGMLIYPSSVLNDMTYGIRTSESVLITAMEGVGKTELMHAIEYNALKETDYAVGAIFLEEPKGRHLQALAGIELGCPAHLPDCGCSDNEIASALERVVGVDDRLHIYSHFGSDDPRVIEDVVRFLVSARGCKLVLLDHITMVVSGLSGEDERQALDYLSTRLEMMVKELDFALVFVSHVNDMGQTRGSRLISKNCDVRIDMTRDVMNPDPLERNTTYFQVSKNRPIGRTGPAGCLIYDPKTCRYSEPANDNTPADEFFGEIAA